MTETTRHESTPQANGAHRVELTETAPSRSAVHLDPSLRAADRSIGELLSQVTNDLSTLLRQEVELAKAEAKDEARKAGKAAGMFGAAGFAGYMVAVFATVTILAALAVVLPVAVAAVIVTVLWGLAGAVLYLRGRRELAAVQGMPKTKQSVKEDAEWARHPTS